MTMYMISNRQMIVSVTAIILSVAACSWFTKTFFDYMDLPEVWMSQNSCIKVVNFKNGDGYGCQDKDIILRKYVVVNVR